MKQSKTLMVVGAHHDDVELNAGTIVRHVAAGWRVVALVATNGRWTPQGVSADNIEIRNRESLAAARLLGMETVFLGFDEGHFDDTPAARDARTSRISFMHFAGGPWDWAADGKQNIYVSTVLSKP